jgi:hypothetical protein
MLLPEHIQVFQVLNDSFEMQHKQYLSFTIHIVKQIFTVYDLYIFSGLKVY